LERNHSLVQPNTLANLDSCAQGPIVLNRSVRVCCLETIRSHANRNKETPETQGIKFRDQKIRYFTTEDQEFHGCSRGANQYCGGRKDNFGDPAGDTEGYPPPSLYPAPTTATPSAALEHGIQQYQMLGYDQFFLHDVDPAIRGPNHQNGGNDTSRRGLRPERRTKRRTSAHGKLGLCFLRSLRPEGAHFLREARDGASGGGRAYGKNYDPRGIVWQNGYKDGDHDCHYDHRDHRDTAPGRAWVRGVSGAAETPAEPDGRGERKAATKVSPESPMGQRRQNPAREISLQAPSIRTTRARKCVNVTRFFVFSPCSMCCFFPYLWSSSSIFSHSSYSWLFGFRGDLGFSKSDIRWYKQKRRRRAIRKLSEFADWDLPRLTRILHHWTWIIPTGQG